MARSLRPAQVAVLYLLIIAVAEVFTVVFYPLLGLILHIVVLLGLLSNAAYCMNAKQRSLMLSMMMVPLIRIVSVSLPLATFGQTWQYALTAIPLFVAAGLVIRAIPLSRQSIGLRFPAMKHLIPTLAVACSGVPLGILEYRILQPEGIVDSISLRQFILPVVVLVIGTGLMEELIFRGILQVTAKRVIGASAAIVYISGMFSILHAGHSNPLYIMFVFGVALYFGWVVEWTRTLLGVGVAHGTINVMLFVVLPLMDAGPSSL